MRLGLLLRLLVPLLLASCAGLRTDGCVALEVVACGVAEPLGRTGQVTAPQTGLGYVHEVDRMAIPHFRQACPAVDVGVGDRIGLVVRVLGDIREPAIPVVTRVTHPSISKPGDGTARTVDEWQWQLDTRYPRYTGWSFDHAWELAPGEWRFEVIHQGRAIATRTFTVRSTSKSP